MRALLVSGDPVHASALVEALTDAADTEVASTPDAALATVADGAFDILLVDLGSIGSPDAVAFIETARSRAPLVPIVALAPSPEHAVEALAAGADGFGPRDPGAASTLRLVIRHTRERFRPSPDTPLRVLYVTRHTPMRDDATSTPMTIERVMPTSEATMPPPWDVGRLDCDAAVLDVSAGGADLVGLAQDLVARLGDSPLFVLADATDRQLARAVLRLGARQVVARTGAWPVRLFAAIQQAATPAARVPSSLPAGNDVVPLAAHRALAAQLDAALSELDALRASVDERLQREVATLGQSMTEAVRKAVREAEAGRTAEARAAALEVQHLEATIRQQQSELDTARGVIAAAERELEAAHEAAKRAEADAVAAREAATQAGLAADDARAQRATPTPSVEQAISTGDGGFTIAAADFVREIARHAGEAARVQRDILDRLPDGPDQASMHTVLDAAARAEEVAHQFLDFDESRQAQPTPIGLDDLLASLLPVLTAMTGGSVRLSLKAAPVEHRVLVRVPRTGVARLTASLVGAAVDALPLGGHIEIEAAVNDDSADWPETTARITVAVRGFGMRPLRAPEALASELPPWSLDLRLRETERGTAYEMTLPATVSISG